MDKILIALYLLISCTALVYCDSSKTIPSELEELAKNLPLPAGANELDLDQMIKHSTAAMKEKCLNVTNGKEEAYENIMKEGHALAECVQNFVNITELQLEIEANSKNGSLETVFNKYCRKRSVPMECIEKFANVTEVCLENEELEQKVLVMDFIKIMLEFVCHKDGDHIALFIADGGPECFQNRSEQLQVCGENFANKYMSPDETKPTIPKGVNISRTNCEDIEPLKECMVLELEKCNNTTPGNLVESMFRQIKKECLKRTTGEPSSANVIGTFSTPVMIIGTMFMALFAKFLI